LWEERLGVSDLQYRFKSDGIRRLSSIPMVFFGQETQP
jgi:hypothetical protein